MAGIFRMQSRRVSALDKRTALFDQLVSAIEHHFKSGENSEELERGARALVQAGIDFGIIDASKVDVEAMVRENVRQGWTLKKVLDEVSGKTRGLPRDDEDYLGRSPKKRWTVL
jgi:hypothetical protein